MHTLTVKYHGRTFVFRQTSIAADGTPTVSRPAGFWGGAIAVTLYEASGATNAEIVEVLEILTREGFGGWIVGRMDSRAMKPSLTEFSISYDIPEGSSAVASIVVTYRAQREAVTGTLTANGDVWEVGS